MIDPAEVLPEQKWPPITVPQVHAICAMTDPVLRNLRITQGYHDLKTALTRLFGARNVTWCAYATWASKTAGRFIRGEEVPSLIRNYLSGADPITEVVAHVMRDVSANVAHGNLIVFQELAPLYAAWLETFQPRPTVPDATQIDAFIADHLTPGSVDQGGQDLLIQARPHAAAPRRWRRLLPRRVRSSGHPRRGLALRMEWPGCNSAIARAGPRTPIARDRVAMDLARAQRAHHRRHTGAVVPAAAVPRGIPARPYPDPGMQIVAPLINARCRNPRS